MKRLSICLLFTLVTTFCWAQNNAQLPDVKLKNLSGKEISIQSIENDGPIMINFWATWCKPCILELSAIHDEYQDWVEETGVKVYAISIDDIRNSVRVPSFVNGRNWEFEVLLDANSDLKRALNVTNIPHTFILNSKKEIVWQHTSYNPGDEQMYLEVLTKIKNGESIENHK